MEIAALCITVLFGVYLIFVGFMMFFTPNKVKVLISKAGSTYHINLLELIPRLLVGVSLVLVPTEFKTSYAYAGYFLVILAIVLRVLPLSLHNRFSKGAENFLKPIYL